MTSGRAVIVPILSRLEPASVLDLGCGTCNFSRRFIDRGTPVTGVDKAPTTQSHGPFTFLQQDIRDFGFGNGFDLVIASGTLHFLSNSDATELIKRMKASSPAGGHHLFICMSRQERPDDKHHFYPDHATLKTLYADWDILENAACLSKKHGEDMHQHKMIVFLARRPADGAQ